MAEIRATASGDGHPGSSHLAPAAWEQAKNTGTDMQYEGLKEEGPTDRSQTWSYRGWGSKALDLVTLAGCMVVPITLIFTAEQWASIEGDVSKFTPRVLAIILFGLGALLVVWPTGHLLTRLTVLGFSAALPGKQPAAGLQPNALEVMIHQWWGFMACAMSTIILVVTETTATPRQLRLLNAVLASVLFGAVFCFSAHWIDNTQPAYWCVMCILLFGLLAASALMSAI